MCGIAGVYLRDASFEVALDPMLDTLLDEIEHRGGDATGFVSFGDEGVTEWQKAACGAKDFCKYRRPVPKGTRTILAHTRWATQGLPAFVENNHPLKRGSFYVIHNGHVSNDSQLFELANRQRFGQVDSEALPARFASFGKLAAAPKVMSEVVGAAAIAVVDEAHPDELVLAKGFSSPLFVLQTKKIVIWGSTPATVKAAYEGHVGRLPRKAKINPLKEGTVLHFVDGKLKKRSFTAYSPPKVKYTPQAVPAWKEISTECSIRPTKWDEEDMLECDGCQEEVSWKDISYEWDDDEKFTWQFCTKCAPQYMAADDDVIGTYEGMASEDFDFVNAAVLEED